MLVAIAVMIGSFRETVIYWVAQTLRADLYIATARRSNLDAQATISPSLEQAIAGDPDVGGVDRFRALSVTFRDRLIVLGVRGLPRAAGPRRAGVQGAADGPARWRRPSAVTRSWCRRACPCGLGCNVGDRIDVPTPPARARFRSRPSTSTTRPIGAWSSWIARRSSVTSATSAPTSLSVYLRPGATPRPCAPA